jgi:hypothetical protein
MMAARRQVRSERRRFRSHEKSVHATRTWIPINVIRVLRYTGSMSEMFMVDPSLTLFTAVLWGAVKEQRQAGICEPT